MPRRTIQPHQIPTQPAFRKVYIGKSPAGVEWWAYKPENVAPMRASLQRHWANHRARAAARAGAPL